MQPQPSQIWDQLDPDQRAVLKTIYQVDRDVETSTGRSRQVGTRESPAEGVRRWLDYSPSKFQRSRNLAAVLNRIRLARPYLQIVDLLTSLDLLQTRTVEVKFIIGGRNHVEKIDQIQLLPLGRQVVEAGSRL